MMNNANRAGREKNESMGGMQQQQQQQLRSSLPARMPAGAHLRLAYNAQLQTMGLPSQQRFAPPIFGNQLQLLPPATTPALSNHAGQMLQPQPQSLALPQLLQPTAQTENLQSRTREQVLNAIRFSIPLEEKEAFLEAMEKAPDVVERESDIMNFLRHCDFDLWASAKRLCAYWASRKRSFGPRAHLPMDLSGRGAMTDTDILNLQAGFPALLPRAKNGKRVIFVDRRQIMPKSLYDKMRSQNKGKSDSESHANLVKRSPFYMTHWISQEEQAQTDGVIFLVLLALPRLQDYDRPAQKRAFTALANAFPIKYKIHLIVCPPTYATHSHSKRYVLQELVTSFVGQLLESSISSDDIHVHFEREKGQILDELLEVGLVREGIPNLLGGDWTFDHFSKWCQERVQHDLQASVERCCGPPSGLTGMDGVEETTIAASGDTQHKHEAPTKVSARAAAGESENQPAENSNLTQQQRRKAKNIIHSRQKRARRRQEQEALHQEHNRLVIENAKLKNEEKQLQKWMEEGLALVSRGGPRELQNNRVEKANYRL
mmetsp:Transcript_21848/g.60744  ORF Transcript_21848/g.60744 Transcript_21848/m.60744 type:complete len:545 (+) Transcript_21848:114-1748(+)